MAKTKTMSVNHPMAKELSEYANFSKTGSIKGMKDKYYGKNALLVKCGNYIYDVTSNPALYEAAN